MEKVIKVEFEYPLILPHPPILPHPLTPSHSISNIYQDYSVLILSLLGTLVLI